MSMSSVVRRIKRRLRKSDLLVIEAYGLHTERPEWAKQAPAQVEAALKRGAQVIAFTELGAVHDVLFKQLTALAQRYGYALTRAKGGDSVLAFRTSESTLPFEVPSDGDPIAGVRFWFHGRQVTVLGTHWPPNHPANAAAREATTAAVIEAMNEGSKGSGISFVMADSNPSKALKDPSGEPRHTLNAAGIVLANESLDEWPVGLGVALVAHHSKDTSVTVKSAVLGDALGSDHRPNTVTFSVKRPAR